MLTRQGAWTRLELRLPESAYAPRGFDAGDANLRRVVGNAPTNATDPSGLYNPKKTWQLLSKERQERARVLAEKGWRLYDEKSSPQNWLKDIPNSVNFDEDTTVRVVVGNQKMIKKLLDDRADIQWVHDGWAVDFTRKQIWIDHHSNEKAARILGDIIDAVYTAGSHSVPKWSNYDVDLLGKASPPAKDHLDGWEHTYDSLKHNWAGEKRRIQGNLDEADPNRIKIENWTTQRRRRAITVVSLAHHLKWSGLKAGMELLTDGKFSKAKDAIDIIRISDTLDELNKREDKLDKDKN